MNNMTALVSTFAKAFHYRNSNSHVFEDPLAEKILSEQDYKAISQNMTQGIAFFAPDFQGTKEEALQFIVEHQLAPSVLARSAFCEHEIRKAIENECLQIVIYACGYDTFSLRIREPKLKVFELDKPEMIEDKQRRIIQAGLESVCQTERIGCDLSDPAWKNTLVQAGYDPQLLSFGSLLGIIYYLSKKEFRSLIQSIASISCPGSYICFDYPLLEDGITSQCTRELAAGAGEPMKARYSFDELSDLLSQAGFQICKHLNPSEMTDAFFAEYNCQNPEHTMTAPEGTAYCLAVKK